MEDLDFTEEEIKEQLENLGYKNVSESRLREFKRDLERLVQHERSRNSSSSTAATVNDESTDSIAAPVYQARNNGHLRYPLNDTGNVHQASTHLSSHDHFKYGKENYARRNDQERDFSSRINIPTATYHIKGVPMSQIEHDYGQADTTLDTTASSDRRMIKRKTVRKRDGHSVYEESMLDSEIDDVSSVQDAMERLRIPEYSQHRPSTTISHRATCSRPVSARSEPIYRLPDDFEGPKALIRPMTADPHTRNIKKSDPVSRYQQYRASWMAQRAPGEKSHKSLRWNVREHMLYHDEVVEKKQHRVNGPNKYVIPSDKKRKNLRWQVRQDLAQGVVPPSIFE